MKRANPARILGLIALGAMLALLGGCAAPAQNQVGARRLYQGEAEKLLAMHAVKPESEEEMRAEASPSAQSLEEHGDFLAGRGDLAAALFQYSRALGLAQDDQKLRLWEKSASLHLVGGNFHQAADLYGRLLEAGQNTGPNLQGQGLALFGLGELEAAREPLTRALAADPGLWRAHNALGIVLNRQGQPRQAAVHFQAALGLKPGMAEIHNNLGFAQLLAGDLENARMSLEKAVRLKPDYKRAYNNLGLVLSRLGRWEEARAAFERSVGAGGAANNLGCVLAWQGNEEQAQSQFRRAVAETPRYYPLAKRHLEQMAHLQAGIQSDRLVVELADPTSLRRESTPHQGAQKPARPALSPLPVAEPLDQKAGPGPLTSGPAWSDRAEDFTPAALTTRTTAAPGGTTLERKAPAISGRNGQTLAGAFGQGLLSTLSSEGSAGEFDF